MSSSYLIAQRSKKLLRRHLKQLFRASASLHTFGKKQRKEGRRVSLI